MRIVPKLKSGPGSTSTVTGTGSGSSVSGLSDSTGVPATWMLMAPP